MENVLTLDPDDCEVLHHYKKYYQGIVLESKKILAQNKID